MAKKSKTKLYLRFRTPEGKQSPYCPAALDSKKRVRPHWCLVKGVEEHHPEASYYLRCKKDGKWSWEGVGSDTNVALDRLAGLIPRSQRQPKKTSSPEIVVKSSPIAGVKLDAAIAEYLTTGKAAEKDWRKHTLQCYTLALRLFRDSCKKTYLHEIDGDDLRQFKVFLRSQKTSIGKKIDPRTVWNHFNNVVSFLNTYGRKEFIPQSEWPTYEKKKVVSYDPEKMGRLLQFANDDKRDVGIFSRCRF